MVMYCGFVARVPEKKIFFTSALSFFGFPMRTLPSDFCHGFNKYLHPEEPLGETGWCLLLLKICICLTCIYYYCCYLYQHDEYEYNFTC